MYGTGKAQFPLKRSHPAVKGGIHHLGVKQAKVQGQLHYLQVELLHQPTHSLEMTFPLFLRLPGIHIPAGERDLCRAKLYLFGHGPSAPSKAPRIAASMAM